MKNLSDPLSLLTRVYSKLWRLYLLYIKKDDFLVEIKRWFSDRGDETHRLDYPTLNKNSIVFDLGGHMGDFADAINKKYGCKVYLFEPHPSFYLACTRRFAENKDIILLNYGVSDSKGSFALSDSAAGSSFINPKHQGNTSITCEVENLSSVLSSLGVTRVDLMKINIEGAEYQLLQYMADSCMLNVVNEYQIQFHKFIKDAEAKREAITKHLEKTHVRTWCYSFVWENWKIKTEPERPVADL